VIRRKKIGDLLIEEGLLTTADVEYALSRKQKDEKFGRTLLREGLITEQQLIEALESQLGIPQINILQYPIETEATKLVQSDFAKRHLLIPIRIDGNKLLVAMVDPMDYYATEELRITTGFQIVPVISKENGIRQAITKYYELNESLQEVMSDLSKDGQSIEMLDDEREMLDDTNAELIEEDSAIVRLVNQIIANAVAQRASDIHFDPQEKELKIRYRIDGVLRTERSLPKHMQKIIIARVKIMGNLNITENRIPQDGRIKMHIGLKPIDLRLSTLPSVNGEKIVMRILDLSNALDEIDKIGFTDENLEKFMTMIEKPNGIILITGPTGSGKSSTLYAALNHLNQEEVNIITVEDPVEYQLEGVNQIQVNEAVGMTFANGLRSILRQDPDIVMVGEIRDTETAEISIRASLTGHLTLSTLHTNSAIAALSRLSDMEIEPFLIASSLTGVVGQRLVRRVCLDCKQAERATKREQEIFRQHGLQIDVIERGQGCESCNYTGYRGRLAIHEVLIVDDGIRDLIMNRESTNHIAEYAEKHRMQFLIDDGLYKVMQGLTTTEEVLRVTSME